MKFSVGSNSLLYLTIIHSKTNKYLAANFIHLTPFFNFFIFIYLFSSFCLFFALSSGQFTAIYKLLHIPQQLMYDLSSYVYALRVVLIITNNQYI